MSPIIVLQFRREVRHQTDDDERFVAVVFDVVFFVGRDEKHVSGADLGPLVALSDLTPAGAHELLMLPGMMVRRDDAAGGHLDDAHAEINGPVSLADNHPARDAVHGGGCQIPGRHVAVINNLHSLLLMNSLTT